MPRRRSGLPVAGIQAAAVTAALFFDGCDGSLIANRDAGIKATSSTETQSRAAPVGPALSSNRVCDPLSFGAVGDGTTDNTAAIQSAVNSCAALGGGIVELHAAGNQAVYLTGPFRLLSHVHLWLDRGVTLQASNDHSRYVGAYINWVYRPNEALISAAGATDVGIGGAGIVDGGGGGLQPNGSPSWWALARAGAPTSTRPWLLEFYQCDQVTISGVTLQNAPMWTQALRFSSNITESGVKVTAPATAPNTDGVDVVGSNHVTLSNLNISVGDDNIAFKSGLPVDPNDSKQRGLPQMATSHVRVIDITAGEGDGIVFGSEAANGLNDISVQNVRYTNTVYGIRIKSARDRGGEVYAITAEDLVMRGVAFPISMSDYYPGGGPAEPPYEPARPITPTTPYIHDITIQNLVATGATIGSTIAGLPESCIQQVKLNHVSIQSSGAGVELRHMTGTFIDVTSTTASPHPPFLVQENATLTTFGRTPAIKDTPPRTGQIACSAQSSLYHESIGALARRFTDSS